MFYIYTMKGVINLVPDFELSADAELSNICRSLGKQQYHQVIQHVFELPYRRNSSKEDLSLVFKEACGTCSSKHAVLVQLALENGFDKIQLILGMYRMSAANTPGVATVLDQYQLAYLPEAHNYIKYQEQRIDLTNLSSTNVSPFDSLYEEIQIQPEQIGQFKMNYHRQFLANWLRTENKHYNLEEIWSIREACIAALAKK